MSESEAKLMKRARSVSYEQVSAMLDFMGQHGKFATGLLRSVEARHQSKQLWGELAQILNNCRGGTRKSKDGWSKYWSDFKNKLKNKVRIINKRTRMGEKITRPLTRLERRTLTILGPCFERKITQAPGRRAKKPPDCAVKVEVMDEESEIDRDSQHELDILELPGEKSPELLTEGQSYEEGDSSELDEDSDKNPNEPLMNSLYPKWLIDVERKRAEAELARARAEETRARVSASAAAAAAAQADALRALARAADAQAEAVARIAAALERAPPRNTT